MTYQEFIRSLYNQIIDIYESRVTNEDDFISIELSNSIHLISGIKEDKKGSGDYILFSIDIHESLTKIKDFVDSYFNSKKRLTIKERKECTDFFRKLIVDELSTFNLDKLWKCDLQSEFICFTKDRVVTDFRVEKKCEELWGK